MAELMTRGKGRRRKEEEKAPPAMPNGV